MSINFERKKLYMKQALEEAYKAQKKNEVPIGAIVVKDGEIIGRGHNLRESSQDATTHAEILAIQQANRKLGSWRLTGCEMYVTLEPCAMCSGALVLSRIEKLYFGVRDPKGGASGSLLNLLQDERLNHQVDIEQGILAEECSSILKDFFKALRERNKKDKKRE